MSRAEVKPPPEVWRLNGLEIKPFMKIKEACAVTGLSQIYLRRGVRDGTIPHIVSGPEIRAWHIHDKYAGAAEAVRGPAPWWELFGAGVR